MSENSGHSLLISLRLFLGSSRVAWSLQLPAAIVDETCEAAWSSIELVWLGLLMIFSMVGSNTSFSIDAKVVCPGARARVVLACAANVGRLCGGSEGSQSRWRAAARRGRARTQGRGPPGAAR